MYYAIGTVMTIIMTLGISENFAILYTYFRNRKIQTVDNLFIVGIALSDIGQAIFGVPFVVIASFSERWVFGFSVCQYYAFVTTFLGISQVAMLTLLAVDRYFIIVRCNRKFSNSFCSCTATITSSFLYGLGWATGPLVGWSGYEEEIKGVACSVSWEIKNANNMSYTLSLFTFGWFIPLFLIGFGYISIAWTIYRDRIVKRHVRVSSVKKQNRDRKVAVTVLLMIGAFVATWLPYSVVSMCSVVGNFDDIPKWAQVAPAVFAKCSIIWNPVIYVARHSTFRRAVMESISCIKIIPFIGEKCKYKSKKRNVPVSLMIKSKSNRNKDVIDIASECLSSISCNNNSYDGLCTTKLSRTHNDTCINIKERSKANITDSIEAFSMTTFNEEQCLSQTLEKSKSQYNTLSKGITKDSAYPQSIQDMDVKKGGDHEDRVTKESNSVTKTHIRQEKDFTFELSSLAFHCAKSGTDESKHNSQYPFCVRHNLFDKHRSETSSKLFQEDRALSGQDSVRMKTKNKQIGKIDTLYKQRLKLRKQLACLYSELDRTQSLHGHYSEKSPPVINCRPKTIAFVLDLDELIHMSTTAGKATKRYINRDVSREMCKDQNELYQVPLHSRRLSKAHKVPKSNSSETEFEIKHDTGTYKPYQNNVSNLGMSGKSKQMVTESDKMYSEADPLFRTCTCMIHDTSLTLRDKRSNAKQESSFGDLNMMSDESFTADGQSDADKLKENKTILRNKTKYFQV